MFIRWGLLAFIQFILMIINAVFSPIISLFISRAGYLPEWLSYFQTTDAPAIGDESFHQNEMSWTAAYPKFLSNYICGIAWAIRNPAYGFADRAGFIINNPHSFTTTRKSGLPDIDVGETSAVVGSVFRTLINGDGKKYFEYRRVGRWNANYVWYIQIGWSIPELSFVNGERCHLCVYIRPRILSKLKQEQL